MELCTDLKLKEQLKKDQKFSVSELGSFYQDFGFPILKPPSVRKVSRKSNLENRLIVKNPLEIKPL